MSDSSLPNAARHVISTVSILGGAVAVAVAATHPAGAAAAFAAVQSAVSCATTAACVIGTNTASGPAVSGTSAHGTGVIAQGSTGVVATGTTGVKGTGNTGYGLQGSSSASDGVFGYSNSGTAGVAGSSPSHYGVYGYTTASSGGVGVYGSGASYGVYGVTPAGTGIGTAGYATGSGVGAYGYGGSGKGVEALSSSGTALFAQEYGAGVAGYFAASTGSAIQGFSSGNDVSLLVRNSKGNGADAQGGYIGVVGRTPTTGYPFVATDLNSNNLFYVDGAGNVSYHGGLFHFAHITGGALVKSFTPNTTLPTVEDTGTAQLVGGAAVVQLEPTFAASIDAASSYRVFVTPNGDTHGLFVATKTASGFIVREAQGGRSTVTFDYRIVATAAGQRGQRMTVANAALEPRAAAPLAARIDATPLLAPPK